jgi:hypothetical protein
VSELAMVLSDAIAVDLSNEGKRVLCIEIIWSGILASLAFQRVRHVARKGRNLIIVVVHVVQDMVGQTKEDGETFQVIAPFLSKIIVFDAYKSLAAIFKSPYRGFCNYTMSFPSLVATERLL